MTLWEITTTGIIIEKETSIQFAWHIRNYDKDSKKDRVQRQKGTQEEKMKKSTIIYGAIIAFFMSQATVLAEGLPWLDQQYPYDFIFGNHIDTHQQTMVLPDGTLQWVLYIEFTGE